MKDKKIMIIGIVLGVMFLGLLLFFFLNKKEQQLYVYFDTDGGSVVEKIAIKKGDTITLPETKKDGYNFMGWYKGNNKVNEQTKYYDTTTLFARWIKEGAYTFTITFDSDGGTEVEKLVVECEKELNLPINPTKDGYEFVSWIDKNETPILDKALLACEDITLKANWKKIEEKVQETNKETTKKEESKKTETVKEVTYTCPDGYTLSGTKCTSQINSKEKCPDGTIGDGTMCIKTSDSNGGTRQCKEDTVSIDGKGHTWTGSGDYYFYGNSYGKCAYYKWTNYTTQSQCTQAYDVNHKTVWVSELNGCYAETKMGNYETVCASDYQYYGSDELSSKFGIHDNGKCLKKISKTKYCDDGYTLSGDKCVKTIDATAN